MAIVIWVALGFAYSWSVLNLARMSRSPDLRLLSDASSSSSDDLRIDLVPADGTHRDATPTAELLRRSRPVTLGRSS